MSRSKLALSALAATFVLGAAPALADPAAVTRSIEVDVSGYDMTTDTGARLVLKRIERAAEQACQYRTGPRPLEERRMVNQCIATAVDNAISDLSTTRERQAALESARRG